MNQEEIQKGVVQLLNGKVAEAVLTTPETDVLHISGQYVTGPGGGLR